jgi:hypothetical protein
MGSWLKLHRSIITSSVWELGPNQTRLFIWILSRVDYNTGTMRTTAGEIGAGIEYMDRNTWRRPTRKTCMTYVKQLEVVNSIKAEVINRQGIKITVINWAKYQESKEVGNSEDARGVNRDDPVEVEVEVEVEPKTFMSANVPVVAKYYQDKINPKAKSTTAAKKKISTRLETYTLQEIQVAIDTFTNDNWQMEHNAGRGMAWFFHTDDRVDGFLGKAAKAQPTRPEERFVN